MGQKKNIIKFNKVEIGDVIELHYYSGMQMRPFTVTEICKHYIKGTGLNSEGKKSCFEINNTRSYFSNSDIVLVKKCDHIAYRSFKSAYGDIHKNAIIEYRYIGDDSGAVYFGRCVGRFGSVLFIFNGIDTIQVEQEVVEFREYKLYKVK